MGDDQNPDTDPDPASASQAFYTRWAGLYDTLARYAPGVRHLREAAVTALAPRRGDVVVEMGAGTGANVSHLRAAVGPEGSVVGVDFAPGVLARATAREDAHFVRADATRPPLSSREVDDVFASFVSGMLADPEGAVRTWADLAGPGGRLALLDLARTTRPFARRLNPLFAGFVRLGSPPGARTGDAPTRLDRRVAAAHRTLREVCTSVSYETRIAGFARLSAGTVEE